MCKCWFEAMLHRGHYWGLWRNGWHLSVAVQDNYIYSSIQHHIRFLPTVNISNNNYPTFSFSSAGGEVLWEWHGHVHEGIRGNIETFQQQKNIFLHFIVWKQREECLCDFAVQELASGHEGEIYNCMCWCHHSRWHLDPEQNVLANLPNEL